METNRFFQGLPPVISPRERNIRFIFAQITIVPQLYLTVTNDLSYDQRMQRICGSLAAAGYPVTLVGRRLKDSISLNNQGFKQVRLRCFFNKGWLFYAEFNVRLFFFLLFRRTLGICAIDLDTILPCLLVSAIKRVPRIYDAHELFCEMKEVVSRPRIYRFWKWVERWAVPRFTLGYTVNHLIAEEFREMYGSRFEVIRSLPVLRPLSGRPHERFILYQGAVNEGRCFETLIPAMRNINANLVICGNGNFFQQAQKLAVSFGVHDKVRFEGSVSPDQLREYTARAYLGITLFERGSRSNYFSLANRFFDYMHAGVPQLCVNYPLYREITDAFPFAILIDEPTEDNIIVAVNSILSDPVRWEALHQQCLKASKQLNWQEEEKKLINYYNRIFGKTSSYHHT